MDSIKVTVYLSTYNQEPYLRQALDSILMQKCDFRYELLIADDCSTDGTQAIALEYQKRFPDIITTYFTPVNVGGCKKLTNCIDLGLFRGEYLAYLEGDDYWLGENRLQVLVDFLEAHPEYSRVSHQRDVIDEDGNYLGPDTPENLLNKTFTIEDFLEGRDYSDFGSVFRNYFLIAGNKYHPLIQASRNVCDFQDMFITQDFGPTYVLPNIFGTYRLHQSADASNYNSITTSVYRAKDHLRICDAVEDFYPGEYDLRPLRRRLQKRLIESATANLDSQAFSEARQYVPTDTMKEILPEILYHAVREKQSVKVDFVKAQLTRFERRGLSVKVLLCGLGHVWRRVTVQKPDLQRRGYVVRYRNEIGNQRE